MNNFLLIFKPLTVSSKFEIENFLKYNFLSIHPLNLTQIGNEIQKLFQQVNRRVKIEVGVQVYLA